ncbi:MAG TPA: alpha/beta fold hydrolase [Acidimicrobiia bacterium]|nr:alpha/beta fold hydrolase [Acidimicrobiia bacterium]
MSGSGVRPFQIAVGDDVLDDLAGRLARVRWPDEIPGSAGTWEYGTDLGYLKELVGYWRDGYDWRAQEKAINQYPQFMAEVDGIDVHFLRVEGQGPAPLPLLLCHGWPGSFLEFLRTIPLLTDPGAFGGDPADAFTVIVPSLPGYGFSFKPGQERCGIPRMGGILGRLMTSVLGYERFGVQGGDWGAGVVSQVAYQYASAVVGLHVNLLFTRPGIKPGQEGDATPEERAAQADLDAWFKEGTGYQWIQGTRPQTLAYALTDSPVGLAGWIVEKFRSWSDCGGDVERRFSKDFLLTNVMIYWVTGAIGSSFWPYYAVRHGDPALPPAERIPVPAAHARFPKEMIRVPRSWAEMAYDIRRWTEMEVGGHFAAAEEPEALTGDVREFFRDLR